MNQVMTRQKCVAYVRVSSADQKINGHGIDGQTSACREYAQQQRYDFVQVFKDDITGKALKRPGMDAMLAFLRKQKEPYVVIIYDVARLARDLYVYLVLKKSIAEAGAILESPTMEFGDDPEREFAEHLQASVSELHRRTNARQTVSRTKARLQSGYYCLRVPVGYRRAKTKAEGKIIVPDEPAASVIREALEGYAAGQFQTASEVQRFLRNHPALPEQCKILSRSNTQALLSRPLYAGYITVPVWGLHMVPAMHTPLISLQTHQRILDRLAGRAYAPTRKDLNKEFPLRGFINCVCGKPLMGCFSTSRNGTRHPYYLCQQKGCTEYGKSIRRQVIEDEFAELLGQMRPTPGLVGMAHDMLRDLWDSQAARLKESAKVIKVELAKIGQSIDQLVDRIVETTSPTLVQTYEKRIQELDRKRALLADQQANPVGMRGSFDDLFRTALDYLGNPQKLWVSDRWEDKRATLKLTFADRLTYVRNEGFRTAIPTLPFKMLEGLKGSEMRMVPLR